MQEIRVYFSGPTLLVLVEISLDRGYPPLLKYTLQEMQYQDLIRMGTL